MHAISKMLRTLGFIQQVKYKLRIVIINKKKEKKLVGLPSGPHVHVYLNYRPTGSQSKFQQARHVLCSHCSDEVRRTELQYNTIQYKFIYMAAIRWIKRKTITHKQRHAFKITLLEVDKVFYFTTLSLAAQPTSPAVKRL